MKKLTSGGGWPAIRYTLRKAKEVGGIWRMYKALRTKNACKTCALGMGGQRGGMVNEIGGFAEVCKKSLQAMAADMQGAIKPEFWSTYSIAQLKTFSPYDLEHCGRLVQPVLYERGTEYYRPIDWDEAISRITRRLKSLPPDETFWYFSGRSSNEAGFLLQLFVLGILPVLFLTMARFGPFSIELKRVILLQAAMPSAVFPIIMARHYGGDTSTALRVVIATSVVSLVTIPLWIRSGMTFLGW